MPRGVWTRPTPAERFWAKVEKSDGCWLWTASVSGNMGYGLFAVESSRTGTRFIGAHRFSWELHHGPIPEGAWVLHHCDVPRCVRPDHLFLGDRADNTADKVAKGRQARGDTYWARRYPERVRRGERHGMAKLTDEQASEIRRRRAAGEKGVDLARAFGISGGTVSMIASGKRRSSQSS